MVVALARWHVLFSRSITLFRVQFAALLRGSQLTRDALRHVRVAGKLSPAERARAVHAVMRLKMFSGGVANEAYNLRGDHEMAGPSDLEDRSSTVDGPSTMGGAAEPEIGEYLRRVYSNFIVI
ncbi:hypothetical protein FOZ63_026393 [Perkinsus olseni]|uniref:Uncharacterized protein n=1 Tax=Perkinsus olseni TaxID=32597 RepID=A0A7J6R7G1_PEROL|nr:hypothetical protein FOZ63_026393 [Perkinsus olseni]